MHNMQLKKFSPQDTCTVLVKVTATALQHQVHQTAWSVHPCSQFKALSNLTANHTDPVISIYGSFLGVKHTQLLTTRMLSSILPFTWNLCDLQIQLHSKRARRESNYVEAHKSINWIPDSWTVVPNLNSGIWVCKLDTLTGRTVPQFSMLTVFRENLVTFWRPAYCVANLKLSPT